MKRFVKSIIIFYILLVLSIVISGYLNVNYLIDSGYFFLIITFFTIVALILIAHDLAKNICRGIKKIYFRHFSVVFLSCFLIIFLGCLTLYIVLAMSLAFGGGH